MLVQALDTKLTIERLDERIIRGKMTADKKFYLEHNPDVRDAIADGSLKSAQEHFDCAGFREGRQPYAGFSMF